MNPIGLGGRQPRSKPSPSDTSHRVFRGTAVYTAGAVLQRAITFILLPFFTRILSPTEFGQIGLITTIAAALSVVFSLGLETAIFRGYLRATRESGGAASFINAVGGFAVLAPIAMATLFAATGAPALATMFSVPIDALRLASVGAAATAAATLVPLAILRAQERLRGYLLLTALQVTVTPALTVLFVVVLDWGVTGWMLAYALSGVVLLSRGLVILQHRWSIEWDVAQLRQALEFGIPLVPHGLSHWGLSVSDRAVLGAFVSAAAVGAYYVAYLFSLPISLLAIALSQATQPLYAEADSDSTQQADLGRIISVQAIITVLIAATVALVGPPALVLLFPPAYATAAAVIPWLAAGTGLFGLYLIPMAAVALTAGRTQRVWIITVLAAAANIGLNLLFVPQVGTIAAAVNTTIGYGLLLVGVFLYMRRVCDPPIPYEGRRIATGSLVIGIPTIIAAALTPSASAVGLVVRLAVMVAVAALLLIGPFRTEAQEVWRMVRPRRGRRPA